VRLAFMLASARARLLVRVTALFEE